MKKIFTILIITFFLLPSMLEAHTFYCKIKNIPHSVSLNFVKKHSLTVKSHFAPLGYIYLIYKDHKRVYVTKEPNRIVTYNNKIKTLKLINVNTNKVTEYKLLNCTNSENMY